MEIIEAGQKSITLSDGSERIFLQDGDVVRMTAVVGGKQARDLILERVWVSAEGIGHTQASSVRLCLCIRQNEGSVRPTLYDLPYKAISRGWSLAGTIIDNMRSTA